MLVRKFVNPAQGIRLIWVSIRTLGHNGLKKSVIEDAVGLKALRRLASCKYDVMISRYDENIFEGYLCSQDGFLDEPCYEVIRLIELVRIRRVGSMGQIPRHDEQKPCRLLIWRRSGPTKLLPLCISEILAYQVPQCRDARGRACALAGSTNVIGAEMYIGDMKYPQLGEISHDCSPQDPPSDGSKLMRRSFVLSAYQTAGYNALIAWMQFYMNRRQAERSDFRPGICRYGCRAGVQHEHGGGLWALVEDGIICR